jgi:hypothetical protein
MEGKSGHEAHATGNATVERREEATSVIDELKVRE